MADTSLWDYVGPAIQAGAGIGGALSASGASQNGYSGAIGANQTGLNTSYGALSPYSNTGSAAESALASLYGLGGQTPNFSAFTNTPGYQFQVQQGDNAINRAAAASGNAFSTTTLAQLGNYNSGLAATQYQQYLQNLYGLTQTGAGAASSLGGQAIQGAGNLGTQYGNRGNANASGIAGAAGAIANAAGKLPWGQIGSGVSKLFGRGNNSSSTAPDYSGAGFVSGGGPGGSDYSPYVSALGTGPTTGGYDPSTGLTYDSSGNIDWLGGASDSGP